MTASIISKDDFHTTWQPQLAPSGDLLKYEAVKDLPLTQVWTIVEGEDDSWYAIPGFRVVNKIGYVTTVKHWDDNTPDAVYYEHEEEDDA